MNNVIVATGYVPLKVQHMDQTTFKNLGRSLINTCANAHVPVYSFEDFRYKDCWLAKESPPMVGANPRAPDRFTTDEEHVRSNVVCHQFVEWAWKAYKKCPEADVVVAMTYTVLKQGGFTGKHVRPEHIIEFLNKVKLYKFKDIPFPGITPRGPVDVAGHNWRFCGSTHIWPTKWLREIRREFKDQTRWFIKRVNKTPLDLQIWPLVEQASDLPFRWYKAEYDATQFTSFPGVPK
jgi:hypothetical protein